MVPGEGVEPSLPRGNRILNPARLPIPPSGQHAYKMAVILSLICTMSNLDNPESVGLRVAAAMSGVFVAMLLSQGLFVYLRYSFSENASR